MAHDAALKAHRAARAERDAAVASLTYAINHATSQPTVGGGTASELSRCGSSLSGYTARMSFTSSDCGGNADEVTPQNSSKSLSSTTANSPRLLPSQTSTTKTENTHSPSTSSTLSQLSGQTLRVNFAATDDDDDQLMKQLIRRASQLSTKSKDDDKDVDVDDRFVRDIIRAELPPTSSSFAGDVAMFSMQRQSRRRQRPTPDDHDHPPSAVDPATSPQKPRFVKKSSPGVPATAELGGPLSLRRNNTSPMNCGATAAEHHRFASSLPRSPVHVYHNIDEVLQSPKQVPAASHQSRGCNSNVTKPSPISPSANTRLGNAQLHEHGDTQFFVEVAHF